jgi:hypothetical protein
MSRSTSFGHAWVARIDGFVTHTTQYRQHQSGECGGQHFTAREEFDRVSTVSG